MKPFHSLLQMIDTLHTEEDFREYLEDMRWHGEPVCPHCGSISKHHYKLSQNGEFKSLYKCKDCRERFTVRIGTMFEDSNLPLKKWFYAIFLFLAVIIHKSWYNKVYSCVIVINNYCFYANICE